MRREAIFTGVLLGIGLAGFLDEAILHQILSWHAFYWATDERGRLLSDGLFHVAHTALMLWGVGRLWRGPRTVRPVVGGALVGAGGFNLYDGIVNHLVFHFHLVNERVCPDVHADNSITTCPENIPYEIVFDAIALLVLLAGVLVLRRSREHGSR